MRAQVYGHVKTYTAQLKTKDRHGIGLEHSTGGHLGTQSHRRANISLFLCVCAVP